MVDHPSIENLARVIADTFNNGPSVSGERFDIVMARAAYRLVAEDMREPSEAVRAVLFYECIQAEEFRKLIDARLKEVLGDVHG